MRTALTFTSSAVLLVSLLLSGCSQDSPTDLTSQVKAGLTKVGETVQKAQADDVLENTVDTTKEVLTSTGESVQEGAEVAESALTRVGNATMAVGAATASGLTTVGNTVIEIKTNLTPPPPPNQAQATP